jgi:Putative DNA-binding domain
MDFTSLHRILGHEPGPITDQMIDEAVTQGVVETDDLDWKREVPPARGLASTDFPKDVAAMANSGGGVIVYGVAEAQKAAISRNDIGEVDERHESSLHSAAITAVSPPVFGLKLHRLGQKGTRALAVVVPASVDGPHLIYRGEYFGAPIRNDADTVWMKERQIEATYFARFEERRFGSEALDGLYDDVLAGRDIDERAWLIAVARPRLSDPVRQRMQRDQARQLLGQAPSWALTFAGRGCIHPLESVDLLNPRPGLRRWVASNTATSESRRWREAWMSVHDDGSVTLATAIGGHRGSEGTLPGNCISSSSVEGAVADFMGLLRVMAAHHGDGDYQVRIGVEWAGADRLVMETVDTFGGRFDGGSIPLARVTPVRSTVRTDVDSFEFVHQVRDLALDLVNQGGIENLTQITKPQTHEI